MEVSNVCSAMPERPGQHLYGCFLLTNATAASPVWESLSSDMTEASLPRQTLRKRKRLTAKDIHITQYCVRS